MHHKAIKYINHLDISTSSVPRIDALYFYKETVMKDITRMNLMEILNITVPHVILFSLNNV